MTLPTTMDTNAPGDSWPGDVIRGWEWPVLDAYCIEFGDGSTAYYPSWHVIPNRILKMQGKGAYESAEVTAVSWGD